MQNTINEKAVALMVAVGQDAILTDATIDEINQIPEWSDTHTPDPFCETCEGNGRVWVSAYGTPEVREVWTTEDCDCTKY